MPEIDKRFSDLEDDQVEGMAIARKYARAVYNVLFDGGSSGSEINLGVQLPAGAVVQQIFVYINTAFTLAGGGAATNSLALQCAGTRELIGYFNIKAIPADYGAQYSVSGDARLQQFSSGSFIPVSSDDKFVQVASVPTACNLTVVIRGSSGDEAFATGKASFIVEYLDRD